MCWEFDFTNVQYGCSYNAAAAAAAAVSVRRPYFPVVLWESGEAIIAPSCTTAFPIHKGSTQ